jgi:hypothetical protein
MRRKTPLNTAHENARVEAAAVALHIWYSATPWDVAPSSEKERCRQQAQWMLRAADTTDDRAGVRRVATDRAPTKRKTR